MGTRRADQYDYKDDGIEKIIDTRCASCHNKDATSLPDFTKLEVLKSYTTQSRRDFFFIDTGITYSFIWYQFYFYVCRLYF